MILVQSHVVDTCPSLIIMINTNTHTNTGKQIVSGYKHVSVKSIRFEILPQIRLEEFFFEAPPKENNVVIVCVVHS